MREQDPRRLETLHKNYIVDALPLRPYPMEDVIQAEMENLTATVPELAVNAPRISSTKVSSPSWTAKVFLRACRPNEIVC